MSRVTESTIELFKEAMKFSAGHFTIFSATERERLHGHNFTVYCALTGAVDDNGMIADYGGYKQKLMALCRSWNEYFLLPADSPHLRIERDGDRVLAHYADEIIPFLARDVLVLPVRNVTLEELARLFVERVVEDAEMITRDRITRVVVKVSSAPGQFASSVWTAPPEPPPEESV